MVEEHIHAVLEKCPTMFLRLESTSRRSRASPPAEGLCSRFSKSDPRIQEFPHPHFKSLPVHLPYSTPNQTINRCGFSISILICRESIQSPAASAQYGGRLASAGEHFPYAFN